MIGTTISHYEILDEIGRGGMGVVYRARDRHLDRIVALKVLPAAALQSAEDRARFLREAKAAAQLQHPHIASIFDSDDQVPEGGGDGGSRPFIVMEFVDGESLTDRIAAGPLPLVEVVRISTEIASALQAAHEAGITHRDIKPQNVMLTMKGEVKVLDFGLAKTASSTTLTRQGATLGTIAYMSPEQVQGIDVDHRTDLWALGVTLYEMLTGRHPFSRDYEQAVIYSVLNEDPEPVTALRTGVPMELEHIVDKALEKDAALRYQTAADCIADLKGVAARAGSSSRRTMTSIGSAPTSINRARSGAARSGMWVAGVLGFCAGIAATWLVVTTGSQPERRVQRFGLQVLPGEFPPVAVAVSPSTSYLAFTDGHRVSVRDLESGATWDIPDSKDVNRIVFTRDENWVLLERPGMILKSRVRDGRPFEVTSVAAAFTTVSEAIDGALVYEGGGRIWRIPPEGGAPALAIETDSTIFYNEPRFAPDGRTLFVQQEVTDQPRTIGTYSYPDGGKTGQLPLEDAYSIVLESGHMVVLRGTELHAAPIDWSEPALLGPMVPLGLYSSRGAFSISREGHLFYAPVFKSGGVSGFANRRLRRIRWDAPELELPPARTFYEGVWLDRSGRRAATVITEGERDIWVVDLYSGFRTRITTGSTGRDPSWSPTGDSLMFVDLGESGVARLAVRAADGTGEPRTLFRMEGVTFVRPTWSPDARLVLFGVESPGANQGDLWQLEVATGTARPIIGGEGDQTRGVYSPDGRYVAYEGLARAGATGIWLQSTAFDDLPVRVAADGGSDPRWASDGSGLFFMSDRDLVRVEVDLSGSSPRVGAPRVMASFVDPVRMWDLLADGSGVVTVSDLASETVQVEWADSSRTQVHVILNWVDELSELVPGPR